MYTVAQICAVRQYTSTRPPACLVDCTAFCALGHGAYVTSVSRCASYWFRSDVSPGCHDEATVANRDCYFDNCADRGTNSWSNRIDDSDCYVVDSGILDNPEHRRIDG